MLNVKECFIDEVNTQEWSELSSGSEVCDALQTFEWAQAIRKSLNVRPFFLTVENKGQPIGGVICLRKKILGVFNFWEIRGGPLYVGQNRLVVMESILRTLAKKKRKSTYLLFIPFPLINHGLKEMFETNGLHSVPFRTIILNLERPIEAVWQALDKEARWGVRKAERVGVEVEIASTLSEWRDYSHLHLIHSREKHYITYPYNFFEELFKLHDKNMARLFLARYENKTIAGSLFLVYRKNMLFLQNASLANFLKYNPNNLIQWKSIEWAFKNGVKTYDMGGLPYKKTAYLRGVYEYKTRWDGETQWYNYYVNRMFLHPGIDLIRTSSFASKLFSKLRNYSIIPR